MSASASHDLDSLPTPTLERVTTAHTPAARVLSLGAGVQSTTIAILAAQGRIPGVDAAIFADTGWEPRSVYDHLERLRRDVLEPAGIDLHIVANGHLRNDSVLPDEDVREGRKRYVALPFFLLAPEGDVPVLEACRTCAGEAADGAPVACPECDGALEVDYGQRRPATLTERSGMGRRQCTAEYKLEPIKAKTRELLGAPVNADGSVGRVPFLEYVDDAGKTRKRQPYVEQLIGISLDEIHRAKDSDVRYARNGFPLLDLKWTRKDCLRFLEREGWGSTPKSACIGCPFHGNRAWRDLRDNHPAEWQDAVEFDAAIRTPDVLERLDLRGRPFLHRSLLPLSEAPIDRDTSAALRSDQMDVFEVLREIEWDEAEEPPGCSPFACRTDGL